MLAYHTDAMVNDHIRSDYTITYRTLTNGVVQSSSTGHMTVLSGQLSGKRGSDATSTNVYDANGYLVGVDYTTAGDAPKSGTSKKIFIVDAHGNILLSREQSWNSPTVEQRQILIGDELELRYSINYGTFGDLQAEQRNAFWDAYNADAYQSLVTPGGTITAEAGNNPTTGQTIVVAEGDTLQSIAQRIYGTADAWYRIADANNLEHDSVLVAGTTLVAPAATADTNKLDFNMGKLVGSTAPNLPPPPPDNKNCITLIIVAVAVVVACVVAPYMTGFVAGMGLTGAAATAVAGGLTAAAANVASQAVGIVGGVQDGMNWSGVARSAVGGALNAGLDAVVGNGAGLTSSSFVNAGVSNIASQAVMIATHRQEKFSWSSVAGAAVSGAFVKSDAMRDMQTSMAGDDWSRWAQGAVNGGLGAVFGGVATKFSWASVAGAVVAGGVANSDTMMGIGESMANAGWSPFAQGFVASGVSGFAGNLTKDLVARGKQDWAQIGIATFEGALSTGLEVQRQFNLAHGTSFLFDDALWAAGRRTGEVVGDALGNSSAYGSYPVGDGGFSSAPESKSVPPQALARAMNGGLSSSQLMDGDTDWLRVIGPYAGDVPSRAVGDVANGAGWAEDVAQRKADFDAMFMPKVYVTRVRPSTIDLIANAFHMSSGMASAILNRDTLSVSQFENESFYSGREAAAANPVTRTLWHISGLGSQAGHDFLKAGAGLYSLATDSNARSAAVANIQDTWNNLPRYAIRGMQAFSDMSTGQQVDAAIKFGFDSALSFGAGKVIGATGSAAYGGVKATAGWLAPKAGEFFENYMYRSGAIAYAVPPNQVQPIGGRLPINSQYAGKTFALENLSADLRIKYPNSVDFTPQGHPIFTPYAVAEVEIEGLTGNRVKDSILSNKAVGLDATPDGYVWHHVEDGRTMQLLPSDIHDAVRHTGGAAVIKYR